MKNLLIVGSKSSIARDFMKQTKNKYCFVRLQRGQGGDLNADLTNKDQVYCLSLPKQDLNLDGIIFFQGLKPQLSAKDSEWDRMQEMFALNLTAPLFIIKKFKSKLNHGASVIFLSSVASKKGSYDPSYASAKSGIYGLIQSLASEFTDFRFNSIILGLVEGTPVEKEMTDSFREKHRNRMFDGELIQAHQVSNTINWILDNRNINRAEIPLTGGFII